MHFAISTFGGLVYHLWNLNRWFKSCFISNRLLERIYSEKRAFFVIVHLITIANCIINVKFIIKYINISLKSMEKVTITECYRAE